MSFYYKLSKTSRIMLAATGALCFAMLVLGLLIIKFIYPFEKALPFTFGILIGCAHSMLKTVLLEKSINRTLDMVKGRAEAYARIQAVLRYLLTFAVLAAVMLLPQIFGLFGAIIGILSLQFSAYIANLVLKKI